MGAKTKRCRKGISKLEMMLLRSLLPLLRSGALADQLATVKKTKKEAHGSEAAAAAGVQVVNEACSAGLTEDAGWKVQQPRKKPLVASVSGPGSTDQLLPEGWNVGVSLAQAC